MTLGRLRRGGRWTERTEAASREGELDATMMRGNAALNAHCFDLRQVAAPCLLLLVAAACSAGPASHSLEAPHVPQVSHPALQLSRFMRDPHVAAAPQNPVDCAAQGGRWGPDGILRRVFCNLRTADGGRPCSNRDDCEIGCGYEPRDSFSDDESTKVTEPPTYINCVEPSAQERDRIVAGAVCLRWRVNFGCICLVDRGEVVNICLD